MTTKNLVDNADCFSEFLDMASSSAVGEYEDCRTLMADGEMSESDCEDVLYSAVDQGTRDWFEDCQAGRTNNAEEATPPVGTVDIAALAEFLGVMTDAATDPIGFAKELNDKITEVQKSLGVEPAVVTEEEIVEEAAVGNTTDCTDLISARREAYDDCINAGGNDPECEEMVSTDYDAMIGDCFTEQGISDPAWNAIMDEDTYENVQDCLQSHDDEYQQLTCLQEWGYDNLTDAMTDVVMFERGNNSKQLAENKSKDYWEGYTESDCRDLDKPQDRDDCMDTILEKIREEEDKKFEGWEDPAREKSSWFGLWGKDGKAVHQEAIANSVKSLLSKKVALAKRLTVNCSCSITRKKMIDNLVKKPVTELQELLTMIPVRNRHSRGFFDTLPDDAEMLATP